MLYFKNVRLTENYELENEHWDGLAIDTNCKFLYQHVVCINITMIHV